MNGPRYVVAFDGSAGAQVALRWAVDAAAADGTVDVVAVWEPMVTAVNPWVPTPAFDESVQRDAFFEHVREMVDRTVGGRSFHVRLLTGPAGPSVVDAAVGAHCLVVGRRGRGGFAGLLLGSVADHALRHAPVAVAVVPAAATDATAGATVVGIDGSEHSASALRWAATEADRRGGALVALLAWSFLEQPGTFDPGYGADEAGRYATAFVARVLGERPADVVVVNDRPAAALMERSASGDLVVVGSRGLGAVRGTLLGSVSQQLAHHAASTIVVVHGAT